MTFSTFPTPSPVTVTLDLYVANVRFAVTDRADTTVDVRPTDPGKAADVKAAENTTVAFDAGANTVSIVSRRPRSRFVNFTSKRPESIDVVVALPTDSDVSGEAGICDFHADGALGRVTLKTDLGEIQLVQTGALNLRSGLGEIRVEGVGGAAEVHNGSGDIHVGVIDGTANVSAANGRVHVGVITGAATVKSSNGTVSVDRALSDITAGSANGGVRVGEVVRGKAVVTTKLGGVEVGVRDGSAAWLDLHTTVGQVYNGLDASAAPEAGEPVDRVEVTANTKLGDVTVRRTPRLDHED